MKSLHFLCCKQIVILFSFVLFVSCLEADYDSKASVKTSTNEIKHGTHQPSFEKKNLLGQKSDIQARPKPIIAAPPSKIRAKLNTSPVLTPEYIRIKTSPTFLSEKRQALALQALESIKQMNYTAPQNALPARMRDNASADIQYIDVDEGLQSSYILDIAEDSQGNLWFAGSGNGISRYDGTFFTYFGAAQGLDADVVWALQHDDQHNLWIGTSGNGLIKFDGIQFYHFNKDNGFPASTVFDILKDAKGNLWFATEGNGLIRYKDDVFQQFTQESHNMSSNTILCLTEDSKGNIWMGTQQGGVMMFDGDTFTALDQSHGLPANTVWSVFQDSAGDFWFGTQDGGVSKFNGEGFWHYSEPHGFTSQVVLSITEDQTGNMWFASSGAGLIKKNSEHGVFEHFTNQQGLPLNIFMNVFEDSHGLIWGGSYGGGVVKINDKSFQHFTRNEGLPLNQIWAIHQDTAGDFWFGTYGQGVVKYDGAHFYQYESIQGLSNNYVLAIAQTPDNHLWFGTYGGGLIRYDGKRFWIYRKEHGLPGNFILNLLTDDEGDLWIGTASAGLSRFDGQHFFNYSQDDILLSNEVRSLSKDKGGNIWIGSLDGGLLKISQDTLEQFTLENGLPCMNVRSVYQDSRGEIWIGTRNSGLIKYENGNFRSFDEQEGLSNNSVKSIMEQNILSNEGAEKHAIWAATDRGLNLLVLNEYSNEYEIIRSFMRQDGLKGIDFFPNTVFKDRDSQIWWGSGKSLTRINASDFRLSTNVPKINLINLMINENFIDWSNDSLASVRFDEVIPFYNLPQQGKLHYHHTHISFSFSAIDWIAPHSLKYSYRLKGLDSEWSGLSSHNFADYRNLPYGKYTFQLKAIGSSNEWSEVYSFDFIITTPWWLSWYAYVLYGILLLVAARFAFYLYSLSLRTRNIQLQEKVYERTRLLSIRTKEIQEKNEELLQQKEEISQQSQELEKLNHNLEHRIVEELSKNRKKDMMLVQQSRQAAMGEMIGNIAHQWRQPLNAVGVIVQNIQEAYDYQELNKEYLDEKVDQCMDIIQYMSQTIDDFRNFFKPEKSAHEFNLKSVVEKSISFVESTLKNHGIELKFEAPDDIMVVGYPNEYAQVVLNLINNAKDVLLERKILNPRVEVILFSKEGKSYLYVSDNAGGISPEVKEKLFTPYFSTKAPGEGTGLGLYMSKTIIEKNMGGKLSFDNTPEGAEFLVVL